MNANPLTSHAQFSQTWLGPACCEDIINEKTELGEGEGRQAGFQRLLRGHLCYLNPGFQAEFPKGSSSCVLGTGM